MPAKTILLAEDDKDDQDFFSAFLKTRSDIVLLPIAETGEEVMEVMQAMQPPALPHVILLDQNMPKRNGLQTLQLLKENGTYKNIPVFIYSTYADEHLKQRSAEGGAITVFSKPYTVEGYGQMVDEMLKTISAL